VNLGVDDPLFGAEELTEFVPCDDVDDINDAVDKLLLNDDEKYEDDVVVERHEFDNDVLDRIQHDRFNVFRLEEE